MKGQYGITFFLLTAIFIRTEATGCPAGQYGSPGSCQACPVGYTSQAGSTQKLECSSCASGYSYASGATQVSYTANTDTLTGCTGVSSPSASPTSSGTPSLSSSGTPTVSVTSSGSPTVSPSRSASGSSSPTVSKTGSPTVSVTSSGTPTLSISSTGSPSPSPTRSSSGSSSPTVSKTGSPTVSMSASGSATQSASSSPLASYPSNSATSSKSAIPTIPSNRPTTSSSATSSATASATSSKAAESPSSSPPASTTTPSTVEVGLAFANVDPAIFSNASTIKNIINAFAKAAEVDSSKVEITSIINKDTGAKIYPVSRRLATANVEVTSRIIVADAAAANTISNKISNDKTAFATSVINDLKSSEAANFQSVTATVSSVAVVSSAPSTETKPALSVGAIIGIIIGVLAAVGIAGYVFYIRGSGSSAKVSSDDPSSDSASDKKMYNNPMPKKTSAKVQSSV